MDVRGERATRNTFSKRYCTNGSHGCLGKMQILSCVLLIATPGTVAHQAPLSMGFPRQECWSGLPFPSLGDLPDSGIKLVSPALVARFFTTEPPRKPDAASEAVGLGWAKIPRFEPAPR